MAKQSLPKPSLEHLHRLTDDTGLFQHAKFTIPLRSEGYTTDDNARALIVATKHYALYHKPGTLRLIDKYLAFVLHSHNDDPPRPLGAGGTVKNFMDFDRKWKPAEPVNDALGRIIWAFGELLAHPPSEIYIPIAQEQIDIAMPSIEKQSLRCKAYSILGLAGYLKQFPDAENAKSCMATAADLIVSRFEKNMKPYPPRRIATSEVSPSAKPTADWPWFEDILTYDNAMLPCALFTARISLGDKKYIEIAKKTCDFLLTHTFAAEHAETTEKSYKINSANSAASAVKTGHFSFIGCNGWFPRGEPKAQFDQQPIEAAGTILMLDAAYKATSACWRDLAEGGKDKKYLMLRRKAFNWFLGENDLGIPLYDSKSKGCGDGLGAEGISANQGAESTISFLLGLLTMLEGHNS